ncbi:hypothetical protein A2872_03135 [Candidatus Gottesmanbacteria bacterium RIFCSPHIGHO2_01_FULL_42_12]|uniref:Glycosyl transferase family 1 domain-containing protein n=1 Tax=Candidatus Gottesmanbacteria bacterium RIFCSPHIGHO2_01_FULL_42_12 TaxID=1798377 RepID=A0A1F5Z0D9_9BACT|nr:MAG: hypothetical protein A2872_03135 [Candidatus Gottesmanbacteria bacterium RIFCSPHIGHO2_01_FULL_42_12]
MRWLGKRVLIVHFRVGRTDGVSLQIACWKEILNRQGATVKLVSGPENDGADFVIPHLENQQDEEIFNLDEEAFGSFKSIKSEAEFILRFEKVQNQIEFEFSKVLEKFKPDQLIISNIFSVGENLPAAGAIFNAIYKFQIPALLVCHDFFWENARYTIPSCQFVNQYVQKLLPPKHHLLTYACINSIAREKLRVRRGINSVLLPDTLDFRQKIGDAGAKCAKLLREFGVARDDLVVLQATRVVRRKNIELAVDLVRELSTPARLKELETRGLYNGKGFEADRNKVVLVLAGYAEKRDEAYLKKLLGYADRSNVKYVHLNGRAEAYASGGRSGPTLLDLHCYADLVTYPSEVEGFGNQVLEAVLSKTPVATFLYPVFKKDILPLGFDVISFGDEVTEDKTTGFKTVPKETLEAAADRCLEVLTDDEKYHAMVSKNFQIAKKHFSYDHPLEIFRKVLFRKRDRIMSKAKIPTENVLGRTIFKFNYYYV